MALPTTYQHFVDPAAARKYSGNTSGALSDVLSDAEAPANSFVTYRNGQREYVSEDVLVGKHVGIIFGGNTSMCWGFCRALAKVYAVVAPEHPLEIVYVSADTRRRDFERFVKSMPWLALPFRDNRSLFERYGVPLKVTAWPVFTIVSPNDNVVFEDAAPVVRQSIQEGRLGALGSLLESTRTETSTFGRFNTLFRHW